MKRFLFIPLFVFASLSFAACDDTVEVCVIDGYCDPDETWAGCPQDCDSACNYDNVCDFDWEDEINCPSDCGTGSYCGDGYCDADENFDNCDADCDASCNTDGVCDAEWGEDLLFCADDCAYDVCEAWQVWIEELGCEDGTFDACVVDMGICEDNLILLSDDAVDQALQDEVDLVEQCAYELALDDGMCTDVEIDFINCAELLIEEGYGEMTCAKKK
ncbi:hypothetical protein KKF84_21490 [Myxococcota bacterium]|nr:hypothetical protein [Myxococcota bacterium]MBU1537900.1 hypothetical protein [Myxococcota bacterium]